MTDDPEKVVPIDAARARARRNVVKGKVSGRKPQPPPPTMPDPDEWPIQVLGRHAGYIFLLDPTGMLCVIRARDLDSSGVVYSLFGAACGWLEEHYAKRELDDDGNWQIQPGTLRAALFKQAIARLVHNAGAFDPARQVRGVGAWRHRGRHDRLALNLGDGVAFVSAAGHVEHRPPLALDGRAYIRGRRLPALADDEPARDLATPLVDFFGGWRWQYQRLAPALLAGAVAASAVAPMLPVIPQLAIAGLAGRPALLAGLQRVLGGWLVVAREATETAIRYRLHYDQVGVLIDPDRQVAGREPRRKRPDAEEAAVWSGPRRSLTFAPREAMAAYGLADDAATLTLRLEPSPAQSWPGAGAIDPGLLPMAFGRMARRWGWLVERVIPTAGALLAEIDGAETEASGLVATLFGCQWALRPGNTLPTADDIDALGDDVDMLMMAEQGERTPPHVRALSLLLDTPIAPERRTVRQLLRIEAGYRRTAGAVLPLAMPAEYQAIRDAATSEDADRARDCNGPLGLRVIGTEPGYRMLAISVGRVPARAAIEDRPGFPPEGCGDGFAELMLMFPGARRSEHAIAFQGYGRHRAVLIPLYPLLELEDADAREDAGDAG